MIRKVLLWVFQRLIAREQCIVCAIAGRLLGAEARLAESQRMAAAAGEDPRREAERFLISEMRVQSAGLPGRAARIEMTPAEERRVQAAGRRTVILMVLARRIMGGNAASEERKHG